MLDFLYTLLIAPLEYWMHAALLWGYSHTRDWGPAIVVMSLAVNIVILPIYIKAERWQEAERALRKSFEAKEAMIKRTFKGQERFAMISTMNRQAGYSPLLSLRSSLGFFLQIPFFFAAYHFLSHFEPLAGVSFLGIADLSKPDALINLGAVSINALPILMTVINLASALVYTHNMTRRDKLQLYGMAAVFLVLLYDAASGLVLYWTCNNIFSLAKNIVWSALQALAAPATRLVLAIRERLPARRPEAFPGGAIYAAPLVLWAAAVVLALVSSNQAQFVAESVKGAVSIASDFAYLASLLCAILLALKLRLWKHHWVLVLLTAVVAYYGLRTWGKWFFWGENRRSFALSAGFLFLIPALGILHAGVDLRRFLYSTAHSIRSTKPAQTLLVPAGMWLTLLLAGYLPVQAYCTAVEQFSEPGVVLAKSLLWCAGLGVGVWLFAAWATCVKARNFAGYFLGAVALVLTVYAFLLPLDTGTIDAFQISNPEPMYRSVNLLVDIAVVLGVLALYAWTIRSGRTILIKTVFVLCILGSLFNGAQLLWQGRGQWQQSEAQQAALKDLPDYNDRLFGFSREGRNIVVVMMDAFTGTHVERILQNNPELKKDLAGFVWYPDTVAAGAATNTGVASILCGYNCTPLALNEQGSDALAEKINRNYAKVVDGLGDGWDVALYERNWLEMMRLARYTDRDVLGLRYLSDVYTDRYIERNNITIGRGSTDEFLLAVSAFSAVPWSGKNLVYRNGRWFESFLGNKEDVLVLRALKDWALFDQLPEISNAKTSGNTFKFIDTELTHSPWFMNLEACRVIARPDRGTTTDGVPLAHLATETCALKALARWFDWMKSQGVWENTTVVLASDHSNGDDPAYNAVFQKAGMHPAPNRANALLMVKKQGAASEFSIDREPVTAAGMASLWVKDNPDRGRVHMLGKPRGQNYLVDRVWRVEGSMFEAQSWKPVQPQEN